MSEINGVGGRSKYVSISSEETLPPGELSKENPKSIETQSSTLVIYGNEQRDNAVSDAARFAGMHIKDASAPVTAASVHVRG